MQTNSARQLTSACPQNQFQLYMTCSSSAFQQKSSDMIVKDPVTREPKSPHDLVTWGHGYREGGHRQVDLVLSISKNNSSALGYPRQVNMPMQTGGVFETTEGALDPPVQIINEDVKQDWPYTKP
ncbi:hypothetical protein DUI87_32797 [Hirundo rustica rustica]|uniref:Uncharacterized protein n=1 Tax=Hirundo rustica rustica TaxID=333673 RepID=A0A3M0IPS8_HIRRU|nr:hypothetical protein DUI87_32797 [Hirundo rustica rustica]